MRRLQAFDSILAWEMMTVARRRRYYFLRFAYSIAHRAGKWPLERQVWNCLLVHGLVALTGLAGATLCVRTVHLGNKWSGLLFRAARLHLREAPPIGWLGPVWWKEWNFEGARTGTASRLVVLLAPFIWASPFGLVLTSARHTTADDLNLYVRTIAISAIGYFYLSLAVQSARSMTGEQDRDCWTSLLSTPLSGWEIVLGKSLSKAARGLRLLLIALPFLRSCALGKVHLRVENQAPD